MKEANTKLAEEKKHQELELERLKAQLAASEQEAKQACEFLAGKYAPAWFYILFLAYKCSKTCITR